jgi:hypothetical protein
MATNQACEQIIASLKDFFDAGIEITADTLFFAESTYGIYGEELRNVLCDRDSEEREVLLGLIFFPDTALRIAIEPLVGNNVFSQADKAGLVERLFDQVKSVALFFPTENESVTVEVTRPLLATFIGKLYLCRNLDTEILIALENNLPKHIANDARVFLRCKHYEYPEKVRLFLSTFINKAAQMHNIFNDLFELSVSLISHVPDHVEIENYFIEQLYLQKKIVRNIKEFEEKRDRYGMEYLLMQKYPVPHESAEEVRHRVHMLTTIIEDVFQIRPSCQNYIGHRDLGHFHSEDDIETLFKRFS